MKLLVFSPYYPPHTGGLESHSAEFNKEIIALGHSVIVFTPHLPSSAPKKESSTNIEILRFPAFEIISNFPFPKLWQREFWNVLKEALRNHPDIIITRTRFFSTSLIGLIVAKIRHIKLIHIEHGSGFVQLTNPLSSLLARIYDEIFGRIIFTYSDQNIAISEAVANFVKYFDKRNAPIIYRGINFQDIDAIDPSLVHTLLPSEKKIIVLTAARLYKWKGIENTLLALKKLPPETLQKILFIIVGDGEDRERLQKLSKNLPVLMVGKKSRTETLALMKNTDIYIHSSLPGGGLSTSLLEAMYNNCSIIATPHEGAKEVITKKNGLLLSDSNPVEIASSLQKLINDTQLRKELAINAHEDILNSFRWEKSISQYQSLFQRL